jgi:hypothetical protein
MARLRSAEVAAAIWSPGSEPYLERILGGVAPTALLYPESQHMDRQSSGVRIRGNGLGHHTYMGHNDAQGSLLVVTLLYAAVNASTRAFLPEIFAASRAEGNLAALIAFGVLTLLVIKRRHPLILEGKRFTQ